MAANRQTYIHTHVCNAVTLMWGSLRLTPIIILMNVQNMTIHVKVCHVKLNKKVSIYMEGM